MPAHKLVLEDVFNQAFKLIAIHSSVEEYKLAYLLNKHLNLRLSRTRKDIDLQEGTFKALFAHYLFEDQQNYCGYHLVANVSKEEVFPGAGGESLFGLQQPAYKKSFLLPEFKNVDFVLKIEDELDAVSEKIFLHKIKEIPQISTAYVIESDRIKSKENLIFE